MRGDATGSSVLQSLNAMSTEVRSGFYHGEIPGDDDCDDASGDPCVECNGVEEPDHGIHIAFADLQKVPDQNTGQTQLEIYAKQLVTLGLRGWADVTLGKDIDESDADAVAARTSHIRAFVCISDQGADEVACWKLAQESAARVRELLPAFIYSVVFVQWCMAHMNQLMVISNEILQ